MNKAALAPDASGSPDKNPWNSFRLKRQSLHAEVIERLRDMIVEGVLAPGERIPEADLCAHFGISRTPLREALRVLASEGLIEPHGGRGSRVTRITTDEIGELFEVVAGLERMAAELAAQRMNAAAIESLRALHVRMEKYFKDGDRHRYFGLNQQTHTKIVHLSGNSVLAATHASLMVKVRRGALFRHPVAGALGRIDPRACGDRRGLCRPRRGARRAPPPRPCQQDGRDRPADLCATLR